MVKPHGKFAWYELMTSDTEGAGRFYRDVVGWTTHAQPATGGPPYTTFNVGEAGVAGMLELPTRPAWIGYVAVDDVDAHIEAMVQAGATVWKAATDVPGTLRFAVLADPQGAPIAIFTPHPAMAEASAGIERPKPPAPGTVGWHELYTTDVEAGFSFYERVFGWTKLNDMDVGKDGIYRLFDQGDGFAMGTGGMMRKPEPVPGSTWNFYFVVDGLGAAKGRVEAGGGQVIVGPMPVPGGSWVVLCQDPQGALFSLVSPRE